MTNRKTPEDAAQKAREALDKMRDEQNPPTVEIHVSDGHASESTTNPDTPWGGVQDPSPEEIAELRRAGPGSFTNKPEPIAVQWCCEKHAALDFALLAYARGFLRGAKEIEKDGPVDAAFQRVLGGLQRHFSPPPPTKEQIFGSIGEALDAMFKGKK